MSRALPIAEFLVLFVALPLAYRFSPVRFPALPLLWLASGYACWQLIRDPHFDRARLWGANQLRPHLGSMVLIFTCVAAMLWLGVRLFAPPLEWSFVRAHPAFWSADKI